MDFRTELSKWGYNKGNSIDVEILIDEILPTLFSQQERSYSEEDLYQLTLESLDLGMRIRQDQLNGYSEKSGKELHKEWFEQNKNK